ncbi:MAG: hypothetical protein HY875_02575 [Chloroflexi bacterium]|nr:hypothetical protein [Chloroflexota bacterium]
MPTVVVTSASPGEGKSGVAAAIARHFAYAGKAVRLVRLAGGANSAADAAWFASLTFAPGSPAEPADTVPAAGDGLTVVEADLAQAAITGASVVLVARGAAPAALPAGLDAAAVVVTAVPAARVGKVAAEVGGKPVVVLAEDRTLAGFSVAEAQALLNADVLVEGDPALAGATCDHLVIAPIASDASQPHFRRFPAKAVVVRFDKTDQHLAAMRGDPACLILTGGRRPSDYLFDAATANGVPVLLSRTDTENTVIALEGVFDQTRFQGERKLDRMASLLEGSALFAALSP